MVDVHTREQRRLNMSRIRGKNTKPELMLRRGMHARGMRFRLHRRDLPGTPDIVFPSRRAAVFVHGCFWHGHACPMFKVPATRTDFWLAKIGSNIRRDAEAFVNLEALGWRTAVVWECALRGPGRQTLEAVVGQVQTFVQGEALTVTIAGGFWSHPGPVSAGR